MAEPADGPSPSLRDCSVFQKINLASLKKLFSTLLTLTSVKFERSVGFYGQHAMALILDLVSGDIPLPHVFTWLDIGDVHQVCEERCLANI